jgi:prepilin-type N-terminal cleavage/methylation domain-containing protein
MDRLSAGRQREGFSLQEVLVVIAIGLMITAMAAPIMSNAIANIKLRSSLTSVSGLLQNTRASAVQQNKTKTACHFSRTSPPYSLVYFVKDATTCTSSTTADTTDAQVELEAPITPYDTPMGAGAPAAIDDATLGLTSDPLTTDPSFNSRGLPCAYSGGTCSASQAFIQYFKDNRIGGSGGWAAISISPAGRIKRWFWNGSSWIS